MPRIGYQLDKNKNGNPRYVIMATNAGGAHSEVVEVHNEASTAIKRAKSLGRSTMNQIFEPDDYRRGEAWTVYVQIYCDECGTSYPEEDGEGERPIIYTKSIPTVRRRG